MSAYHDVYHVYTHGMPDHEALFVETNEQGDRTGHVFHVIGNVLAGMQYDDKTTEAPEQSAEFHRKSRIGRIRQSDYTRLGEICRGIAVPGKQMDLRGRRLDPTVPLRRCGEWLTDAVAALRAEGVLVP